MCLAGNRDAICIAGMQMMMERRDLAGGQALVNQAAVAGDSFVAYFLEMLRYRRNPSDPETLVVLHTISGGPSQVDGRWENRGLPGLRHSIQRDLEIIASRLWLPELRHRPARRRYPCLHMGGMQALWRWDLHHLILQRGVPHPS